MPSINFSRVINTRQFPSTRIFLSFFLVRVFLVFSRFHLILSSHILRFRSSKQLSHNLSGTMDDACTICARVSMHPGLLYPNSNGQRLIAKQYQCTSGHQRAYNDGTTKRFTSDGLFLPLHIPAKSCKSIFFRLSQARCVTETCVMRSESMLVATRLIKPTRIFNVFFSHSQSTDGPSSRYEELPFLKLYANVQRNVAYAANTIT